ARPPGADGAGIGAAARPCDEDADRDRPGEVAEDDQEPAQQDRVHPPPSDDRPKGCTAPENSIGTLRFGACEWAAPYHPRRWPSAPPTTSPSSSSAPAQAGIPRHSARPSWASR